MRGMLSKVNEKIPSENGECTIFPPVREFSNANISKMLPLTDLNFYILQKLINIPIK